MKTAITPTNEAFSKRSIRIHATQIAMYQLHSIKRWKCAAFIVKQRFRLSALNGNALSDDARCMSLSGVGHMSRRNPITPLQLSLAKQEPEDAIRKIVLLASSVVAA